MKLINLLFLLVTINFFGQIQVQSPPVPNDINGGNPFFDASSAYDLSLDSTSAGKGLVFPRTDLTAWTFTIENLYQGSYFFPTAFDGMIVYNSAEGNTLASVGDNNGLVTAVTPGFYYFSNPNGADNRNVTDGVWTKLGSDTVKNYTSTPIDTGIAIEGKTVWAVKGSFTTLGTSALVSVIMPAGMSAYYKMTTYQGISPNIKTFRSDISEFKMTTTVLNIDNVVTGNGLFSEVYPAGTYEYTLEYFK